MQHHQTQELGTPEYIDNKSSKEMYKAAAKQWGITCKMSEQCRCMDCQSHYFDCEFDDVSLFLFFKFVYYQNELSCAFKKELNFLWVSIRSCGVWNKEKKI